MKRACKIAFQNWIIIVIKIVSISYGRLAALVKQWFEKLDQKFCPFCRDSSMIKGLYNDCINIQSPFRIVQNRVKCHHILVILHLLNDGVNHWIMNLDVKIIEFFQLPDCVTWPCITGIWNIIVLLNIIVILQIFYSGVLAKWCKHTKLCRSKYVLCVLNYSYLSDPKNNVIAYKPLGNLLWILLNKARA